MPGWLAGWLAGSWSCLATMIGKVLISYLDTTWHMPNNRKNCSAALGFRMYIQPATVTSLGLIGSGPLSDCQISPAGAGLRGRGGERERDRYEGDPDALARHTPLHQ